VRFPVHKAKQLNIIVYWFNGVLQVTKTSGSSIFKRRFGASNIGLLLTFFVVLAFLLIFMIYPTFLVVMDAFIVDGAPSLEHFYTFWSNSWYQTGLINGILLSLSTVITTTLVGVPLAYIIVRYDFPAKNLFSTLSLIPMVVPPFAGALGLRWVLGHSGMVNLLLKSLGLIHESIPFLFYRIPVNIFGLNCDIHLGMILIQTLHLYPIIYLNSVASLSNIDPSLEEQAENLGASGFRLLRTVIFPLMMPGYIAGVILVFIWVLTDLGTPLIIGYQNVIAYQLYSVALSSYYQSPMAYVMGVIMTATSIILVAMYRRYIGLREYAKVQSGTSGASRIQKIKGAKLAICYIFLISLILVALSPHIGVFLAAFTREWSLTILPASYTLENFIDVISTGYAYISNSFLYSTSVFIADIILGMVIGYILVRQKLFGKEILDYLSMLPLAIPGLVIGLGYWRAWMGTFLDPFYMAPFVLTLSLVLRRLPFSVRATYAGMLQIPKDYEEASMNLGASRLQTFIHITLPLLFLSALAGGILSFTYAMLEVSSTLILIARSNFGTMTWAMFQYANEPHYGWNIASAMGAILIVLVVVSLAIVNKVFKGQMGTLFRF